MEWVKKYKPSVTSEIKGQDKPVGELLAGIKNFKRGDKPILLYGPPGTGKTSSVYAVAKELGLEVVEINASDTRNKASISQIVGGAVAQQSLFSKGKIILVDEVDGLSGQKDRGGIPEIVRVVKNSAFPVILTANDPFASKFSKVRSMSKMIEFGNLNYLSVAAKLKEIADLEKISTSEDVLKALARRAQGDLRAGINDLQTLSSDGSLSKEDIEEVGDRRRADSIFDALMRVFKTTDASIARSAYEDVDMNLDEIFLWVERNISSEYKKPEDLAKAFDNLSLADKFFGRIRRWQHYRFYVYCYDLLSAGIALAKSEKYPGFTKYTRSTKPLMIWRANQKLAKKKSIAQKVAEKTHTSTSQAMKSTVPFMQLAWQNKDYAFGATNFFELDDSEVAWLNNF